jgi:hypothetical protein
MVSLLNKYKPASIISKNRLSKSAKMGATDSLLLFVPLEISHISTGSREKFSVYPEKLRGGTYSNNSYILFALVDLVSRKIIWTDTLSKQETWFNPGYTPRDNDFSEISRLCRQVGFNAYTRTAIQKLNGSLDRFFKSCTGPHKQ